MAESLPSLEGLWISMESITLASMGVNDSHPGALEYIDNSDSRIITLPFNMDWTRSRLNNGSALEDICRSSGLRGTGRCMDSKIQRTIKRKDVSYSESAALSWGF